MGTWGEKPWDSDGASDWFADLHDRTGLRTAVAEVLEGGVNQHGHEAVRAAAWVVVQLGRVYVWPIEHLDGDLKLAVASLEEVWEKRLGPRSDFDPTFKAEIDAEIDALQSRIRPG